MSVPNLSAAVLNLVGREAAPRTAPATATNAAAGDAPAANFLNYLPLAEKPAAPAPLADGAIRQLTGAVGGKPTPGEADASTTQVDARFPEAEDATAAINVWLPMGNHAPLTAPPVDTGQLDVGLNAQAGRAQMAQATISVRTLKPDGSLPEVLNVDAAADAEQLSTDTLPERGALGREIIPQHKPMPAAMPTELAAASTTAREGVGAAATLPEGLQQATMAGSGLERLQAEPAMAQDRLFVSRPGAEPLADPRYTLDASAGPQRLAETAAQRLSWMAGEKISRADLALNPPELGSVDVQMEIEGDQVRIQMSTATGAAKEMLDQALPRLRELFAQEGLQLTQADVSQHREQDARGRSADGNQARHLQGDHEEAQDERTAEESAAQNRQSHIGLLDQYA